MIAEKTSPPRTQRSFTPVASTSAAPSVDFLGALWRYRWAVILPAILFGVLGFLLYLKTDVTYRSSTRLMVESQRPPIFDAMTGEVVGGVPDIDVLQAQLYSDTVARMAYEAPSMLPYRETYGNSLVRFTKEVQDQLKLEPEVTDVKTAQSLITQLHFDSPSPEHCEAAIQAYSKALQAYYNQRHQSTQAELTRLIDVAIKQLAPRLSQMEQRYGEFRRDAPLAWDADGHAINPHRETQQYLTKLRAEMYEELRREETTYQQIKSVATETDPLTALNVMSQLLGVKVSSAANSRELDPLLGDSMLAEIDLEKKLVPLVAAKTQNIAQFGPSHPTVKAVDEELKVMREELMRLAHEQSNRIAKLREEWMGDMGDPVERAKDTVEAVMYSHAAKVEMLNAHIGDLDEQIASEKQKAAELSRFEQDNDAMIREIEQHRDLMRQLEENLGRVKLSSEDEGITQIVELWAPTKAYWVAPSLLKMSGLGTLVGLMLGSGLAYLLEKNANTFRDPDEISVMLGVPILTHIPFFRGKRRKLKKGEVDPYKNLTTDLSVVHQPSSMTSEAVRSLRTAVFFSTNAGDGGKVLQVTSPLPGDGKSTIACNLACSIAQSGKRVLAIDCDLRRPQLTDNFDCNDKLGLTNVLNGECDPLDAAHATPLPKLSVMPCGPIPSNPAEALSLPVMNELLDYLREHYDYIILDTPPLLVVTDPSITASMADGVILTLRIRRKSKPNSREAVNILNGVCGNVLGIVINNSDEASASDGYSGYGYYKHGRYRNHYYRNNGTSNGSSVAVTSNQSLRRPRIVAANGSAAKHGGATAVKAAGPLQVQAVASYDSDGPDKDASGHNPSRDQ